MTRPHLELLVRPTCHLCEGAEPVVSRVAALVGVPVEVIDVDTDPELAVDFGLRIPVVRTSEGHILAEGTIAFWPLLRETLRARIRQRRG